ncbi:MAG TPA: ribosome biogenesis GTPase YlqF, partial [Polyangia bacterium]|nr:ribosome biogenesis GTPase YlqF [Polyangia bacterium]
ARHVPRAVLTPMPITWYPGHMLTDRKEAAEVMGRTDLVIEVLDARAARASLNPHIEKLRRVNKRPALKLLNKSDLADPARTPAWLSFYNAQPGTRAIALSAKKQGDIPRILKEARALVPDRGTGAKPLRMMILGIPNVGKSTLMNALLKRKVAAVGDQPAITKMQMGHALGAGMWLIDTPGFVWPGMAQDTALTLAAAHAIGRGAYDDQEVATHLATYLLRHYRSLVTARYGEVPAACQGHELLAWIAEARKLLAKGGGLDLNKAAVVLLDEFRAGTLGRITLETVDEARAEQTPPERDTP